MISPHLPVQMYDKCYEIAASIFNALPRCWLKRPGYVLHEWHIDWSELLFQSHKGLALSKYTTPLCMILFLFINIVVYYEYSAYKYKKNDQCTQ